MKRNKMRKVLCAGVCAAALAGMSLTSYADTETVTQENAAPEQRPEDDQSVMAKILTVDDDSITVYLSVQPEHNGEKTDQDSERPQPNGDMAPADLPADTDSIPAKPENTDGTVQEKPEGEHGKGGQGMMNFSEETTVLTITDDTVITKGMEQESADLSDLSADSIVRIVLEDTTAVSISIMDMEAPQTEAE